MLGGYPVGMIHDGADSPSQAKPAIIGVAQVRRDIILQYRALHLGQQTVLTGEPKVAGIDGNIHVG